MHKSKSFKIFSLLLISSLLISCDIQTNNKPEITSNLAKENIPITSLPILVSPLFKPGYLDKVSRDCKKVDQEKATRFGNWVEYYECKSNVISEFPKIKSFRIHRNKLNEVNAYSFVSFDEKVINYIENFEKLNLKFSPYYCSKYGDGLLRRFVVTKEELCEALRYKQL